MSLLLSSIYSILSTRDEDLSLLRLLYSYIKNNGTVPEREQLGAFAKVNATPAGKISSYTLPDYGDRRLERLLVKGIRKFPADGRRYYSIDFGGHGICHSCVLLGSNGVGKSSFYSAIEWASLGRSDTAKSRSYTTSDEQNEYMRFLGANPKDCEIVLSYYNGESLVNLDMKAVPKITFPAFFCMEQDITELSKKSYSEYIADQLGLYDFYKLLMSFEQLLHSYNELKDSYKEAKLTIDAWDIIDQLAERLSTLDYSDLLILRSASAIRTKKFSHLLKTGSDKDKITYLNALIRRVKRLRSTFLSLFDTEEGNQVRINMVLFPFDDSILEPIVTTGEISWDIAEEGRKKLLEDCLEKIYNDLFKGVYLYWVLFPNESVFKELHRKVANIKDKQNGIIHDLESRCNLLGVTYENFVMFENTYLLLKNNYKAYIDRLVEIGQGVFDTIFGQFLGHDIKSVILQRSADEISLSVVINAINPLTRKEIGEVNPRKYLNTFRFKLFCVSVKVALAICCSKFYGIEFPIVMDDIFDSSDFNNRERIRDFIAHIYACYAKLVTSKHPLQLIFFTQDDVVGDSVYRGIMDYESDSKAKYARIYDFTEAEDSEWHKSYINGEEIEVLLIEDQIQCTL